MSRFSFVLLASALVAFGAGALSLAQARDVAAIFWLAVGAVCVRSATKLASVGARA
jgi:hypothetical protein